MKGVMSLVRCRLLRRLLVLGLVVIPGLAKVNATPFVPRHDAQVLERLRTAPLDARSRALRQLRAQLLQQPDNLALALRLAQGYIERGRAESDPRYFGRAQAVLSPWWQLPQPPSAVLVLRAIIRQSNHAFSDALEDLSLALKLNPRDPQAWVTRALVLQARGEYREAKRHCLALLPLATELVVTTCLNGVTSLHGQASASYHLLRRVLEKTPTATPDVQRWAFTILADIAVRLGQTQAAEEHFARAFALARPHGYLLGLYADFLLDRGRPAEVIALLKEYHRVDALFLRLVLAEQDLHAPTPGYVSALQARFAASRWRGDVRHLREEARFTLHLLQQPATALQLAQANWQVQREPEDVRIFLEAALAAHDADAAQPVLTWLETTRLEDVRLTPLRQRLRGEQP